MNYWMHNQPSQLFHVHTQLGGGGGLGQKVNNRYELFKQHKIITCSYCKCKPCGTHNVQYSVCSGQTSLQIGETSSVLGNLKALIYRLRAWKGKTYYTVCEFAACLLAAVQSMFRPSLAPHSKHKLPAYTPPQLNHSWLCHTQPQPPAFSSL